MVLKRNVLALALASAGLCFTLGVHAAPADNSTPVSGTSAAANAPSPSPQSSAPQSSTPQSSDTQSTTDTSKKVDKATTKKAELAKSLSSITVTGFSNSVEKAIDYQRYADTIQNVVTSADIGGLPDQSIADALTRLPGVTAERIGGQASQINCRGLSGNFIETTLDGREQPSTSGSNYIQFDQYPSELIDMATVYKSTQASLIEGGVGCTIAMQTANPLDNPKDQSLNIDARGSYDGQAHDVTGAGSQGYRFSAAYQGKFLDNTLGIGLGIAQLYQPHVSEQFVGEAYNGLQYLNPPTNTGQQAYVPQGIQMQQNGGEERRTGYLSTIVWKPTDELQVTADAYFSKFNNTSFGYGLRSQDFYSGNAVITNPILAPNGALIGGTASSVPGMANAQYSNETTADNDSQVTNVFSGGLNAKWNHGPWHVEGDLSVSHAYSNQVNVDTTADPYNGLGTSTPTLMPQSTTYALNGSNIGSASFGNPGIYTNLNDMALSRYGIYPYVYHDRYKAFRTSVQYDLDDNPIFSDLQAGIYINNHTYEANRSVWIYGSEWGSYPVTGQPPLQLNSNDTSVVCWQGSFSGFPCFLKINAPAVLAAAGLKPNPQIDYSSANLWSAVQTGSVREKVRDAYFMADIDTTLFGHQLTGNIGMRVAHTSQSSSGLQQVEDGQAAPLTDAYGLTVTDLAPINVGKSYNTYLPSMNLIYHWTDSDQTRFSVGKVLSRPPIDQMLAGAGSWISNGQYNVYGGTSPLLNPLTAWQYDLDYEHYFDNSSGAITVGVFFKDIKTFVEQVTYNNFNFAAAGIPVPINPSTGLPYLNGEYQSSYNANGGPERGFEASFQKTHFLPGFWSGLGVGANIAYTQSPWRQSYSLGGAPMQLTMPGLSKKVASATVFYDNGLFSANITANYRSPWVSDSQMSVTNQYVYFNTEREFDFQSAYNINKNMSLLFQVLNFTNQPTRTYFGNALQTGTIQYFGRTFYGGFNLKF